MAYVINDSCVSCGTCEGECPVGAISAGDGKYEIAADTCIDCGTCLFFCAVASIPDSARSLRPAFLLFSGARNACGACRSFGSLHRAS